MPKTEVPLDRALRLIAHGPVTLLTTEAHERPNIATCSWLMPVAPAPPLVAVSLSADGLTRRNLDAVGEFVINIPPRALGREVHFCGLASGREVRKERETGLRLEQAGKVRAPWIHECMGHLECAAREARAHGSHVLYVAEVLLAVADDLLFDEGWITDDVRARSLHHLGGSLYTSVGRRVVIDVGRPVDWPSGG
jgi:flavin reductase (DIM6/NTAB) family NADH-FMN oxidoreductase RutF